MTFDEILVHVLDLLQRHGRMSYRALKIRFQLDDDYLEGLKDELIYARQLASDEEGKVLVWTGGAGTRPAPLNDQGHVPLSYTPRHLAEKILQSKAALEGERKQVTVLFADLKGSMELLADRDPEEARQLLDPVLEQMMAAVHRYEGTVNQIMGDGIMALFGAPLAHEDHAVRACYAALAMQDAMRRYAEEVRRTQGLTVQMRVGLHSGEVVVRAIGNDLHMDYSAVGQTTHLAARMEQLATPGSILLTAATLRLVEGFVRVQVPATVQALLAARIDRLPPEDKRLLQTAAVIGTEVPWPLLQAIADTSEEALYRSLAQLQAAEFLYETSLFPERAYTFKHALTHEVAYGSLLHERRRGLHARIVAALEILAGDRLDDQLEQLAQHALRGEVWEKALAYGRQAGDKAHTRSAYREAVVYFEQALAALAHLPESRAATEQAIDLRLGMRTALNALGEAPERMLDHLRRAETLAQTLGDQRRLGRVYADMGANCWQAGEVDRAIVYSQRTLAVAAPLGHVGLQARAHLTVGQVYYDAGDSPRAVESLERNVATLQGDLRYERFGTNGSVASASRTWLSYCHAELGAFTEGLAMAEEGLRIAETVNHPFSLIQVCYGVSMVYRRQGDVRRAIPLLERALGLCQDWHISLFVPWMAAALGLAYALDGRVAAGLALAEQAVEQAVASSRPRFLALVVACLSEAYLLAGRLEDARQRAEQACDLARQYQQRGHQAWALWLLGESTARQASPEGETAAGHYRQALALAEELGMRPLQAHCHRSLGMLYGTLGQQEPARRELSTAIALYRTLAMTFWLSQAEAALAQVEK